MRLTPTLLTHHRDRTRVRLEVRPASVIRDAAGIAKKNTVIVHTGFKVSLF